MKEIDLLPEWYKNSRRRQAGYRTQYIALGGIFILMLVWNFVTAHSISKATAQMAYAQSRQAETKLSTQEFNRLKSELAQLQKKTNIIDDLDSKIDVAGVLAELSYLIDEKIVLSKIDFKAEKFANSQNITVNSGTAVRVADNNFARKVSPLLGRVRFKVVISGVASDASDVAELICKLEDSPYFCQVYPSFSRNAEVKTPARGTNDSLQVSEFEISCYLANYCEK
jgi:Tfp pilus assembly protein PilN